MQINQNPYEGARPDKLIQKKLGKLTFQHQKVVNEMLSLIAVVDMDVELKMILRMKIWGRTPTFFAPMDYWQIATELGCKAEDVRKWEKDALENIKMYLNRVDINEACAKAVQDKKLKDIVEPEKTTRIIVPNNN